MTGISAPRVLVFDSGIGGLSIAASIHQSLPGVDLVYLADNAGFPYGEQPESVVIERCTTLVMDTLARVSCDIIVIACNTASTVVLPRLRSMTRVPVVGVVPAVKPAAAITRNQRIGVLATPATVRRPYLDELIQEFASHCQVERIGHPGLVQWVESSVSGLPVPRNDLAQAVAGFRTAGVDTVVLGCTHYPLLLEPLKDVLPEVAFWVDSGAAIARRTAYLLAQQGKSAGEIQYGAPVSMALFSGPAPSALAGFMARLGLQPAAVLGHWPRNSVATEAGSV